MQTTVNVSQNQFNVFSNMLESANDEVKLQLISFLSTSLLKKEKAEKGDWAKEFSGAWEDSRSAEEIIDDIRRDRTKNKEIKL